MSRKSKRIVAGILAAVALIAAIVIGSGADIADATGFDSDTPITGAALSEASAAALEYMGEGKVTDTEVGDEDGYYEVEVTLEDGSQVDVHLDENFNVLNHEADASDADDSDADGVDGASTD